MGVIGLVDRLEHADRFPFERHRHGQHRFGVIRRLAIDHTEYAFVLVRLVQSHGLLVRENPPCYAAVQRYTDGTQLLHQIPRSSQKTQVMVVIVVDQERTALTAC